MEDRDKDVLQKNRMYLSKNIGKTQIVNVVNELYSQDILTIDDTELILSKAETSSKVFELLHVLVCRGPKAFDEFLQALWCCGCGFVAINIQPKLTGKFAAEAYEQKGLFCLGLPSVTPKFTGRNEDCEKITRMLTSNAENIRIGLVVAPPGFGKTEVAKEVGHMMKDQGNNLLYISLRTVTLMTTAAKRMLDAIGIPVGVDPIWQIGQYLQSLQKPTVLILDNAEDLQNKDGKPFSTFLEKISTSARNLVTLVTSRICLSKLDANFEFFSVPLKPLTDEQSLLFLKNYNVEHQWAKRFSPFKVCGGVPLLLKITASFLTQSGTIDPVELHKSLQKCKDQFLMGKHPDIQDLVCHLGVLYNHLPPDIKKALSYLAAFPTVFTKIEAKIVLFEDESQLNFQLMLDSLEKHSLVHRDDVDGCQQYSLHPLVQAFCVTSRGNLDDNDYDHAIRLFSQHYLGLLHQANEDFISTVCKDAIDQYQLNKINICHALMVAAKDEYLNSYGLHIATETVNFLAKCMNLNEFLSVYEEFLKVAKDLRNKALYSECLTAIGLKQVCFHGYKDAYHTEAMAKLQDAHRWLKSLGINNECRGYCECKLGLCTFAAGENKKGISLLARGIALRKRLARAQDAGKTEEMLVGGGFSDLAMAMYESGEYRAAINIWKKVCLTRYRKILGTHPFTASVLDCLGNAYMKDNRPQEAVKCKRESLEMRCFLLGEEHLDTARAYYGLGCALRILGSTTEALENLRKAYHIQVRSHASQQDKERTERELQHLSGMQADTLQGLSKPRDKFPHFLDEGRGDEKAIEKEGGNEVQDDRGGAQAHKTETQGQEGYEQDTYDDDLEQEEPDKVAIFEGTVTSQGIHLDLFVGTIHLTFPPDTVAEPTRIMVYKWKYGACLPHLKEHEAVVSNVIEISPTTEVGASKFNGEVKLVLSHSAADLEGYELVIKVLTDVETNEWEEIPGCEDIRQVSDIDDYPCACKVPYSFPVVRAGITKCSTYAVVSRLKLSSTYTITVSGGTFAHPDYPQVTVTIPQKAVATETRLSLQLKVQEVPQDEFWGHHLFAGPILHVLCSSRATFLEPVTIQLPISLGDNLVNIPHPSKCRVRIFFLSSERGIKEWIEISDELKKPASYDGKLVKFKVHGFSRYTFLLDWTKKGFNAVASGIIGYLSNIVWNQPLVASFFAYFKPTEGLNSHDILFLMCCPTHLREKVKQEQEKEGITSREATSRNYMIPGRDKAFVFVSGGVSPARPEGKDDCYLRFYGNITYRAQLQVHVNCIDKFCIVDFRNTREKTEKDILLATLSLKLSSPRIVHKDSSFPNSSVPSLEQAPKGCLNSTSSRKLKVTFLTSEWGSSKGGLSTMNRELAIQLAKHDNVEVCMYLPAFSDEDREAADKCRVLLLKAEEKPGYDPIDWLASVPSDHQMDVVIGHGIPLGKQVPHIKRSHSECKWVQVVHTDPEENGMFKSYADATAKGEKKRDAEMGLCQQADLILAIGPKLADTSSRRSCEEGKVLDLTPGIFSEFTNMKQDIKERRTFHVLVFGRGDSEDFQLKGYDIASRAVAELKDEQPPVKLVFVGAPNGKEEEVKRMLLKKGILPRQLIVRSAKEREQLAQQFYEADLVIMPSRTEGFGLAALETLSAGLPVLVSGNTGLGKALEEMPFGKTVVVNSEDPAEWAKAIRGVRDKHRNLRLKEASDLRKNYSEKYSWEEKCSRLIGKIRELAAGAGHHAPRMQENHTVEGDDLSQPAQETSPVRKKS